MVGKSGDFAYKVLDNDIVTYRYIIKDGYRLVAVSQLLFANTSIEPQQRLLTIQLEMECPEIIPFPKW